MLFSSGYKTIQSLTLRRKKQIPCLFVEILHVLPVFPVSSLSSWVLLHSNPAWVAVYRHKNSSLPPLFQVPFRHSWNLTQVWIPLLQQPLLRRRPSGPPCRAQKNWPLKYAWPSWRVRARPQMSQGPPRLYFFFPLSLIQANMNSLTQVRH